jgi:hypothetical protein
MATVQVWVDEWCAVPVAGEGDPDAGGVPSGEPYPDGCSAAGRRMFGCSAAGSTMRRRCLFFRRRLCVPRRFRMPRYRRLFRRRLCSPIRRRRCLLVRPSPWPVRLCIVRRRRHVMNAGCRVRWKWRVRG